MEEDQPIERPVPLPDDVLRILQKDGRVQTCLEQGRSLDQIPADWFVAAEQNLNDGESSDLLIMANNSCLFGANVAPFWIFRGTLQGYRLVLDVPALTLRILDSRTNGYLDIETSAATTVEIAYAAFRSDGKEYRLHRA